MHALKLAVESHDAQAVIALLAPNIIIRSPITTLIRFEGIDQTGDLFRRVFSVVSGIRFYETVGNDGKTQVIFWRGRVGKHYLEEANLLRLNAQGRIAEMTMFMRAVPGLLALATELASSLASRQGRLRSYIVRFMLGFIGVLYRTHESLVIALAGAGVAAEPEK